MGLNSICHSLPSQQGTFYQPPHQDPPHQTKPMSAEVTCMCGCSTLRQPMASEHFSNQLDDGKKSLLPCAIICCALVGVWDKG